jgi:hypothetical protein
MATAKQKEAGRRNIAKARQAQSARVGQALVTSAVVVFEGAGLRVIFVLDFMR